MGRRGREGRRGGGAGLGYNLTTFFAGIYFLGSRWRANAR